jgi:hypothetical protein
MALGIRSSQSLHKAALDGEHLHRRRASAQRRLSQRDDSKVRARPNATQESAETSSVWPTALQCS